MQAQGVSLNDILLQYLQDGGRSQPSDLMTNRDPITRLLLSYGCNSTCERESLSLNSDGSCSTSLSECTTLRNNLTMETMSNTINSHNQRGRDHLVSLNNTNNNESGFTNWWNDMLMSATTHEQEATTMATATTQQTASDHERVYSQMKPIIPIISSQHTDYILFHAEGSTSMPNCYNSSNQEPNAAPFPNSVSANMACRSYIEDAKIGQISALKETASYASWAFPRAISAATRMGTATNMDMQPGQIMRPILAPNPTHHTLSLLRDDRHQHHPHANANSNSNSNYDYDNASAMERNMKAPAFEYNYMAADAVPNSVIIPSSINPSALIAAQDVPFIKRLPLDPSPSKPPAKKERIGDRIATLQQLVSPFGKTDTASVLLEAIGYIKLLHDQVQVLSTPYMQKSPAPHTNQVESLSTLGKRSRDSGYEEPNQDLQSKGLCLVPLSWTMHATNGL